MIEIKDVYGRILFVSQKATISEALEDAVKDGANLDGANLDGANLDGANLARANLAGANLARANLARANLDGANLARANLDGANLARANLAGANLARANLAGAYLARATVELEAKLIGSRPIQQIDHIGSRDSTLIGYSTDKGLLIRAGCFFGTRDDFAAAVAETHGNNEHSREYAAALELMDLHHEIWSVK